VQAFDLGAEGADDAEGFRRVDRLAEDGQAGVEVGVERAIRRRRLPGMWSVWLVDEAPEGDEGGGEEVDLAGGFPGCAAAGVFDRDRRHGPEVGEPVVGLGPALVGSEWRQRRDGDGNAFEEGRRGGRSLRLQSTSTGPG
jgi:hypothetical protein